METNIYAATMLIPGKAILYCGKPARIVEGISIPSVEVCGDDEDCFCCVCDLAARPKFKLAYEDNNGVIHIVILDVKSAPEYIQEVKPS